MRKSCLFAVVCLTLVGLMACSGDKRNKVQDFANSFAGYVKANQIDSIKAIYPTANFDSIAPITAGSIQITETNGIFHIDFGGNKWIEAKQNENGSLMVVNSKGLAAFPQEKYDIAVNTGMLNDSIPDTKAQELLNDSAYFVWLNDKAKESYKNAIEVTINNDKYNFRPEESIDGKIDITIKNNLPITLKSNQYNIEYTMYQPAISVEDHAWKGTRKKSGVSVESGKIVNMTIKDSGKLSNPRAVLKISLEEYLSNYYKPTGKEYQEYLGTKK